MKATISDVLVPIGPILLQLFAILFTFAKVISVFNLEMVADASIEIGTVMSVLGLVFLFALPKAISILKRGIRKKFVKSYSKPSQMNFSQLPEFSTTIIKSGLIILATIPIISGCFMAIFNGIPQNPISISAFFKTGTIHHSGAFLLSNEYGNKASTSGYIFYRFRFRVRTFFSIWKVTWKYHQLNQSIYQSTTSFSITWEISSIKFRQFVTRHQHVKFIMKLIGWTILKIGCSKKWKLLQRNRIKRIAAQWLHSRKMDCLSKTMIMQPITKKLWTVGWVKDQKTWKRKENHFIRICLPVGRT